MAVPQAVSITVRAGACERIAATLGDQRAVLLERAQLPELDQACVGARLGGAHGQDLKNSTRIVSPSNRGAGKMTSVMPRLAMVVPTVVSLTEMPIINPRA